jgi:hypothetical protein
MDSYDERLAHYIEIGAIDPVGLDINGDVIFNVTEKAKDLVPELWKAHSGYIDEILIDLFEKDLITVEYNENLQALISLTIEAKEIIEKKGIIPLNYDD